MPTPGNLTITGEEQGLMEGSCELEEREGTILVQAFDHVVEMFQKLDDSIRQDG